MRRNGRQAISSTTAGVVYIIIRHEDKIIFDIEEERKKCKTQIPKNPNKVFCFFCLFVSFMLFFCFSFESTLYHTHVLLFRSYFFFFCKNLRIFNLFSPTNFSSAGSSLSTRTVLHHSSRLH